MPGFEAGARPPRRRNPYGSGVTTKCLRSFLRSFDPAEDRGVEPLRTGLQPVALPTELISDMAIVGRYCRFEHLSLLPIVAKLTGQDSNLHLTG